MGNAPKRQRRKTPSECWAFAQLGWWKCAAIRNVPVPPSLPALRWFGALDEIRDKETRARTLRVLATRPGLQDHEVRAALFHNALCAKWRLSDPSSATARRDKALDGFIQRNMAASTYGRIPYPYAGIMRTMLRRWLPRVEEFDEETRELVTGRFGPGACAEKLSHYKRFLALKDWSQSDTHWPDIPYPVNGLGGQLAQHNVARLHAVPKDTTKDRLITVEPAYGTFTQQYVRSLLLRSIHTGPLRGSAADMEHVDTPALQRRLALRASRKKDQATVDLSDASDHITWDAVQEVFPSWVVALLEVTRSFEFCDPRSKQVSRLHIYAGMGNATTFVIETLFFLAAVKAVAIAHGLHDRRVTVFGDDIICSSDVVPLLGNLCPFLAVNALKTFSGVDNIRESCGIYAYQGVDVTFPDIRGYLDNFEGRSGVAELYTRLRLAYGGQFSGIADDIRSTGLLPTLPTYVPGYPSIWSGEVRLPRDIPQRINSNTQCLELKLPVEEQVTQFIPANERARALGFPPGSSKALLYACLCGMLHLVERRRKGIIEYGYSLPLGRFRVRNRWLAALPLPDLGDGGPGYENNLRDPRLEHVAR